MNGTLQKLPWITSALLSVLAATGWYKAMLTEQKLNQNSCAEDLVSSTTTVYQSRSKEAHNPVETEALRSATFSSESSAALSEEQKLLLKHPAVQQMIEKKSEARALLLTAQKVQTYEEKEAKKVLAESWPVRALT